MVKQLVNIKLNGTFSLAETFSGIDIRKYGSLIFLVLMVFVNTLITPHFFALGTLNNLMLQVYPVFIVSLGMTLVIASGGIDISVGAVMALSASVTGRMFASGAGLSLSLLGGLITACLCGLFSGLLVAKFKIQPIIVTLIMMIGGRGLAQIVLGELFLSFYDTKLEWLGVLKVFGVIPIQIVIMVVLSAVLIFAVRKTLFGRFIEALGDNSSAARLVGIRIPFYLMLLYTLSGLAAGIAGIMEGARINAINAGTLGLLVELDAIAAVAIGGTSFTGGKPRVIGTIMGALIVQLITITVNMNDIQFHYSLVVKAFIVIAALYLQRDRKG